MAPELWIEAGGAVNVRKALSRVLSRATGPHLDRRLSLSRDRERTDFRRSSERDLDLFLSLPPVLDFSADLVLHSLESMSRPLLSRSAALVHVQASHSLSSASTLLLTRQPSWTQHDMTTSYDLCR